MSIGIVHIEYNMKEKQKQKNNKKGIMYKKRKKMNGRLSFLGTRLTAGQGNQFRINHKRMYWEYYLRLDDLKNLFKRLIRVV